VRDLAAGLDGYRAGQTGLLRLVWDNGDRTVLVNARLGGVTLGWNLTHTPADELFAAIEGTAFHTRIVLERMAQYGTPIERVIQAGGVPQRNPVLNQVYANVMHKPMLVPERPITSLGSAIIAFVAAGVFPSIADAQRALCPSYREVRPDPSTSAVYDNLYNMYRTLYFGLGAPDSAPVAIGEILPALRDVAAHARA
jgi:L-ribulokinase